LYSAVTAETLFSSTKSARSAVFIGASRSSPRNPNKEHMMDELFEKVKKIIADKLEVEEGKITLDASFRQDLGADSLDTYELVYGIEEELGIQIPDEKANEFETVRDAYEFIKTQVK
jgi:acyl carrier protein